MLEREFIHNGVKITRDEWISLFGIEPPEPDHEPTTEDKAEAYDILTGVSE